MKSQNESATSSEKPNVSLGWGYPDEKLCPELRWQKPWPQRYQNQLLRELRSEQTPLSLATVDFRQIHALAAEGLLKPLDSELPLSSLKPFFPAALEMCSHEGKLYGLPEDFISYVLISRRDILSKHHLSPPQTWRDLEKQLRLLSKTLKGPLLGVPGEGRGAFLGFLISALASNGLRSFNSTDDLPEKPCVEAYTFVQNLHKQGWLDLQRLKTRTYLAHDFKKDLFGDQWVYVFCSTNHLGKQSPKLLNNMYVESFPIGPSARSRAIVIRGHAWIVPKSATTPKKGISALSKITSLPSAVKNECQVGSYLFHARQDVWSNSKVLKASPAYRFAKALLKKDNDYLPYPSDSDFLHTFTDNFTHSLKHDEAPAKWFSKIPRSIIKNVGHTVEFAADYIKKHLDEIQTIEQLSDKLQKSRRHLDRLFQQKMHMTCSDYLRSLKMQQAADLLKNPVFSIKEIALKIGMDAKAFSRAFNQFFGSSPRAMRKITLKKKYSASNRT